MKDEIFKRLDAIGEKLGVAATHLYAVYVHQSVVEGIANMIVTGIALLVLAVAVWLFRRGMNIPKDYDNRCTDEAKTFMILSSIGAFIALWFVCGYFVSGVQYLMNPEYWAIHRLVEDLRTAVGK